MILTSCVSLGKILNLLSTVRWELVPFVDSEELKKSLARGGLYSN